MPTRTLGESLRPATQRIRDLIPEASRMRLRRATRNGRVQFQLIGELNGASKAVKLEARDAFSAVDEVRQRWAEISGQVSTGSHTPVSGALQRAQRAALEELSRKGLRDQTESQHATHIRRLCSWLGDRGMGVSASNLLQAIRATDKAARERRSRITAAHYVARAAGIDLKVPTEEQYKAPKPGLVKEIDDNKIIEAYEILWEKEPADAWLVGVAIVTGARFNTVLSMEIEGVQDVGDIIIAWDSKRAQQIQCTPTIRGFWQKYRLDFRPDEWDPLVMPSDRPATNDQVRRANAEINNMMHRITRKLSPEHARILGARNLRSAAVARLLKAGVDPIQVASLVSTSVEQIYARYSRFFKASSVRAAQRLL